MPHQCVHCGRLYPDAAKELLIGCSNCKSHFFYFIKKEYYDRLSKQVQEGVNRELKKELAPIFEKETKFDEVDFAVKELQGKIEELNKFDKAKMEKDVREIIGVSEKEDIPVILDLESIRVLKPGKFEIDVVNLFNKKRPLIYKLEEGKYIIDLASTLKLNAEELKKRMIDPDKK